MTVKDIANGTRFTEGSLVQLDSYNPGITIDSMMTPAAACGVVTPVQHAYLQAFLTPEKHQLVPA